MLQVDEDNETTGVVRRDPIPHCAAYFLGGVHGRSAVPGPRRTRRDQHHLALGSLQSPGQQLLLEMCRTVLTVGHPLAEASSWSGPWASYTLRVQTSLPGTAATDNTDIRPSAVF